MSKKTYISPAGGKYEGDFKDGQRHGKGTYIYPSGSKYVGEYKDDKKHGKGTFTFLGGHDPEDYQHFVGDPQTDLSLHQNSPGYRLILNNILFPAAKKKERKT